MVRTADDINHIEEEDEELIPLRIGLLAQAIMHEKTCPGDESLFGMGHEAYNKVCDEKV